jgi:hypothetical protein
VYFSPLSLILYFCKYRVLLFAISDPLLSCSSPQGAWWWSSDDQSRSDAILIFFGANNTSDKPLGRRREDYHVAEVKRFTASLIEMKKNVTTPNLAV